MKIRPALPDDSAAFNAMYNPFIIETPATFETTAFDEISRRRWIEDRASNPRLPVFVADGGEGRIVGFAGASAFDPREAYETSVKVSVFIAPDAQGQGLGNRLYRALFDRLGQEDIHRAYGLIVAPNPASVALHQRFGFHHVSTLDEVGRKFGRYYSVMWFEKRF